MKWKIFFANFWPFQKTRFVLYLIKSLISLQPYLTFYNIFCLKLIAQLAIKKTYLSEKCPFLSVCSDNFICIMFMTTTSMYSKSQNPTFYNQRFTLSQKKQSTSSLHLYQKGLLNIFLVLKHICLSIYLGNVGCGKVQDL